MLTHCWWESMCECSSPFSRVTPGLQPTRFLCPRGLSRQEYWSGLLFPLPEDLPNPGIEPTAPAPSAVQMELFTSEPPGKPGWKLSKRHKSTGKQLNTQHYKDPIIRSLVIYPSKMKTYAKMFTRALLLIIKTWKFKCVSTGEWINCGTTNVNSIQNKNNKLLIYTTPQTNLNCTCYLKRSRLKWLHTV